MTKNVAAQLIS